MGSFPPPENLQSKWVPITRGGFERRPDICETCPLIASDVHSHALCTSAQHCHAAYKPDGVPAPTRGRSQKHLFPISTVRGRGSRPALPPLPSF